MFEDERAGRVIEGLRRFYETPLDTLLTPERPPEETALALFHEVAGRVPAYAAFLAERGIDPARVRTFADFSRLPLLTRADYLQKYPLPDRCRDGRLTACDFLAVSSGSTGSPTFWPRFVTDEAAVAARFEQVFRDAFRAHERTTLAVVCFPLGTWVGGLYTAFCCRHLAAKGYPITIVAPGNNKAEILRVVPELAPHFDQTVLLGYPPFVKDVIDTGRAQGLAWHRFGCKLVFAGEVFSEEWRALVCERVGASNPLTDTASLYGTADAGVLAVETPLSIAIRQWLAGHPAHAHSLFGESRLPTLAQYDPSSRLFEVHEGTLLFTGDNGAPLIRYHISDTGGAMPFDTLLAFCQERGFEPPTDGARPQPFVWVFGRSHFTISYFGANVFPENVTVGLEDAAIREWVTGKFVLETFEDEDREVRLRLTVELAPGEAGDDARALCIAESVRTQLLRLNSEFAHYVPAERQHPQVGLRPHGDPEYFPIGVKHRYTRKGA